MRNYEIIKEIYKRLPSAEAFRLCSKDQLFDRIMDCRDLIERERRLGGYTLASGRNLNDEE